MSKESKTDRTIAQAESLMRILENLGGGTSIQKVQRGGDLAKLNDRLVSIDSRLRRIEQQNHEPQLLPESWQTIATHDAPSTLQ